MVTRSTFSPSVCMRTTLDIADDVLMAVKESELARAALTHRVREDAEAKKPQSFYGFKPLPFRGAAVTNELIDKLREEDL